MPWESSQGELVAARESLQTLICLFVLQGKRIQKSQLLTVCLVASHKKFHVSWFCVCFYFSYFCFFCIVTR